MNSAPNDVLKLSKSLESHVFTNYKRKVDQQYKRRIQSLYLNLKDKKNPGLRARVISGEISTERLATMEAKDMASEERKAEDAKIQQENLRKSMVSKPQRSVSDQLTCGKCGQKKVTYTQAQTRSADEPMTTFCACENCGHLWKVISLTCPLHQYPLLTVYTVLINEIRSSTANHVHNVSWIQSGLRNCTYLGSYSWRLRR